MTVPDKKRRYTFYTLCTIFLFISIIQHKQESRRVSYLWPDRQWGHSLPVLPPRRRHPVPHWSRIGPGLPDGPLLPISNSPQGDPHSQQLRLQIYRGQFRLRPSSHLSLSELSHLWLLPTPWTVHRALIRAWPAGGGSC